MKLDEAIEIKETELEGTVEHSFFELREAEMLNIEALKRCKYISEYTTRWANIPLPGETP